MTKEKKKKKAAREAVNETLNASLGGGASEPVPFVPTEPPRVDPKLYKLTPEHEARLAPWRDKWLANALRCGPYTPEEYESCRQALRGLYKSNGYAEPSREVFVRSPVSGAIASSVAHGVWWLRANPSRHRELFECMLTEEMLDAAALEAVKQAANRGEAPQETKDIVEADALVAYRMCVKDPAKPLTVEKSDRQKAGKVKEVTDEVTRFFVACCQQWYRARDGGNQWSGWVAFLSFFRHVARLDLDYSKWQFYEEAAKYGPRFVHQEFWIVSELPDFIKHDDEVRPHAEAGPFVRWRDGVELFYWHGTQIPRAWIVDKEKLDPMTALNWPNMEQRRCAAEIIGWAKVLEKLKPRVLDTDKDPKIGILLEVDLPDAPGERFLKVKCGTGRDFVIPVPSTCRTALAAQADIWQLTEEQVRGYEVRT